MKIEDNKKESRKKPLIISLISITLLSTILIILLKPTFYEPITSLWKSENSKLEQPQEWITIFTHGTFGCLLGLLNVVEVIQDNVSGTSYKKLVSKIRKDDYFYKNQPMLQKGLVKINPTFDLESQENNKYAVYPIAKAYETFLNSTQTKNENNNFYTFGWSGLISQQRRRKEAIRFYNSLSEEIEKYRRDGIDPKIRILCHSHGGNLALNLAGVKNIANNSCDPDKIKVIAKNSDEYESLMNIYEIIKQLPEKENIPISGQLEQSQSSQKKFDYIPYNRNLAIDELILLGTPIQPETEPFIFDKTFKKVFNFYSDEDAIQKIDWVSTKKRYSFKRFNLLDFFSDKKNAVDIPEVIQARVMLRPNMHKKFSQTLTTTNSSAQTNEEPGFWSKLFSFASARKSQDPTHKEFWFPCWESETNLNPLPIVVLTPIFLDLIKKIPSKLKDIDININLSDKKLKIYAFKHDKFLVEKKVTIPISTINELKTNFSIWKPEEVSQSSEFNVIKKYSSLL